MSRLSSTRPARRAAAAAAVVLAVALLSGGLPPAAAAPGAPVFYQPPVDAPLVDRFRPPATTFGTGNLGIDYATAPGTPVGAAAPGTVAFAGPVAGAVHVVVLHDDGIRTTYAFLATAVVARGQRVQAGSVVGTSGARLHFGARAAGDAYVDPLVLLGGGALELRLVPDGRLRPESEGRERSRLRRFLGALPGAAARVGATALDWAADTVAALNPVPSLDELRMLSHTLWSVPVELVLTVPMAAGAWLRSRGTCTPGNLVPPRPSGRRRAVLVAGLGSSSEGAAVYQVGTAELGYDQADVHRFSYRGGTTAHRAYGPADTQGDLEESGRRLRALLEDLQAQEPGVPIDVIAHSQGGLVARSALGQRAPPAVQNLVTLGTPHHGADLAALGALAAGSPVGALLRAMGSTFRPLGIDPKSVAVGQLAETSPFLRELNSRPLPAGVRVTSVAARSDVIVPSPRSRLGGAGNAVVTVGGFNEHADLPASPAAHRALALAVAGLAPACESLADAMTDALSATAITVTEDMATLYVAGVGPGSQPPTGRPGVGPHYTSPSAPALRRGRPTPSPGGTHGRFERRPRARPTGGGSSWLSSP